MSVHITSKFVLEFTKTPMLWVCMLTIEETVYVVWRTPAPRSWGICYVGPYEDCAHHASCVTVLSTKVTTDLGALSSTIR